jgi:ABC-type Fe3+/spermidine/putrescine transport system ATPase subunit
MRVHLTLTLMRTTSPAIAELERITHRFGGTVALDAVDFTLTRGEVVALLGPNGAGKTTLVRVLMGLIRPSEGAARMWGQAPTDRAVRRRVGVMLQVGRVPETLTVREHVHLFSSYYGTPVPVDETLATAGVADVATLTLPAKQETVLALALREAITSVVRHANVTMCRVSLKEQPGGLVLHIQADGVDGVPREGNGFAGMRERVAALGGTVTVDDAHGLSLTVTVP